MSEESVYVGKEIFVVTGSECDEVSTLIFAEDVNSLRQILMALSIEDASELRVFHGIFLPASYIPADINNQSAYVVWIDPEDTTSGFVIDYDVTDTKSLISHIEAEVMCEGSCIDNKQIEMEDLYILYGYRPELCLFVKSEAINDQIIVECDKISKKVLNIIQNCEA